MAEAGTVPLRLYKSKKGDRQMERYVITINRQFGSMGRPIARQLSEILKINYYDRDIVEQTARRLNLSVSTISAAEDYVKSRFSFMRYPLGSEIQARQDEVFRAQEGIIRDFAEKESCIIVGRCADYVLKDFENRLDFYIYAPYEARYQNCVNLLYMEPSEAKYMIKAVDKARDAYHKRYAGYKPGDPEHNDLMINSAMLGAEGTAKYLADLAKLRFGKNVK